MKSIFTWEPLNMQKLVQNLKTLQVKLFGISYWNFSKPIIKTFRAKKLEIDQKLSDNLSESKINYSKKKLSLRNFHRKLGFEREKETVLLKRWKDI